MKTVADAARALEATLLRQLLRESGTFSPQGTGGHVYGDFFVDAAADAVARAGGLGIASVIERSLVKGPTGSAVEPAQAAPSQPQAPGLLEALVIRGPTRVTSGFGPRADPFTGHQRFHGGLDIAAARGTPIHSARDGVVSFAGPAAGYGLMVEVDHGGGLVTRYAHADKLLVHVGMPVQAGSAIAEVGSTGKSTGPHVHIEARVHGRPVDPGTALRTVAGRVEETGREGHLED
jgi:murein DD-endopeptidase MepM/ murein hydrolase activator NlpD